MKIIRTARQHYALLAVASMVCVLCSFPSLLTRPADFMFQNEYDGFKNYLTVRAYLDDMQESILTYEQMNYPWGDYIIYTDNSPLIAVPLKLIDKYLFDISEVSLGIYSWIWMLSLFLAPLVLYRLLVRLIGHQIILLPICIILVWISPQTVRLAIGHFNLSAAIFLICALYLLQGWESSYAERHSVGLRRYLIALCALLILSSFIHLYYLPILALMCGLYIGISAISTARSRSWWWRWLVSSAIALAASAAGVFISLRLIDDRYSLRREGANGYGWDNWEHNIRSLYTSPAEMLIDFPLAASGPINYEGQMYLGWFLLLSLPVLLVLLLGRARHYWPMIKRQRYLLILLAVGTICYFIGLGDDEVVLGKRHHNWLNILEWIKPLWSGVEHFRCLGRFAWWMYWALGIGAAAWIAHIYRSSKTAWKYLLWIPVIMGLTDVAGRVQSFSKNYNKQSTLSARAITERLGDRAETLGAFRPNALLPLPYYHVGTEELDITIDPHRIQMTHHSQTSLGLGLPNMASQMSRTPIQDAEAMWDLLAHPIDSIDHAIDVAAPRRRLLEAINGQTILIMVNRAFYAGTSDYKPKHQPMTDPGVHGAMNWLRSTDAELVDSDYYYDYYIWKP